MYQQTNEQTNVIQEVVSPEVSMFNPAVMNKKQGDQMQFSLEKEDQKKWIHPNHHASLRIVIDSSILLDFYSFVSKCLSCSTKNS